MNKVGKIVSIEPPYAIPGGEVLINCENFRISGDGEYGCYFGGERARLVGASRSRVLAIIPENLTTVETEIYLETDGERSESQNYTVGKKLADDLHIVANPAVDPKDNSIVLTRSGSRGQQLPATLFRLEKDGYLNEIQADILNPTGVAFDKTGHLFVTARADGEVLRVSGDEEIVTFASELGIATGIAFNDKGEMFVGDRSGTIHRIENFGDSEIFATLEPSVSAYHLAFGADEKLYVTAPGLSSFDAIYAIDKTGDEQVFYRGLGRPQGLAFDREGNLYVAACFEGKHGVVKINADDKKAEMFVAGMNVVGLCFTRDGDMIVATNDSVYSLSVSIYGILL